MGCREKLWACQLISAKARPHRQQLTLSEGLDMKQAHLKMLVVKVGLAVLVTIEKLGAVIE
ncbi:MAG: hypothetical protein K1X64_14315 [Myxococcaceae bacterium]|nr:hypothetical protein [Myxococcaceae bacterium]